MRPGCLALLLLCAAPGAAHAQVFIASRPQPEFKIGPLFVSASVGKPDAVPHRGPSTVTVSWSLVLPPTRGAADIAQDLYLLWPGELAGKAGAAGADPTLVREVEALGFKVKESGALRFSARARSDMGTGAAPRTLGEAPFVTFGKDGGPARAFWGPRYVITLGFGDVGYVSLYPIYFGARDRVVPLARDFSLLIINFADADHLKVDEMVPASASRRMSETRSNTEAFQLPLAASEGLAPQLLKVQFNYFGGRLPWRPIVISALFLGLGNLTGPLVAALARRLARTLRARVHVGRGERGDRQSGEIPSREALEQIRPGETSYEEVRRLCGPNAEEQQHLPPGDTRTLVYRGERVVPHRRRSFGWFATVSYWDVEHHEVQIDFERERVRDIQARVRRSRLTQSPLV